jgi:hypothetical protein
LEINFPTKAVANNRKMVPATRSIYKSSSVVVSGPVHRDLAQAANTALPHVLKIAQEYEADITILW